MSEPKQPSWCKCGPAQEGQTYGCWPHDESLCHDCAFFRDIYKEHDDLYTRLARAEERIKELENQKSGKSLWPVTDGPGGEYPPSAIERPEAVENLLKYGPCKVAPDRKQEMVERWSVEFGKRFGIAKIHPSRIVSFLSDLIDEAQIIKMNHNS